MNSSFLSSARAGNNQLWRCLATFLFAVSLFLSSGGLLNWANQRFLNTANMPLEVLELAVALLPYLFLILGLWAGIRLLHLRPLYSLVRPGARGGLPFRWGAFALSAALWLVISAAADLGFWLYDPSNYEVIFLPERFWPYALAALLLVPLQAVGEELLFRGYLAQGLGRIGGFWTAWLVPALLFGLLHGLNAQAQAVYGWGSSLAAYIILGLLLGLVTLRSGGLEMALGLHLVNNLYGTLLVRYPGSTLPGTALVNALIDTGPAMLVTLALSAMLYIILTWGIGQRFFQRVAAPLAALAVVLLLPLTSCAPAAAPQAAEKSTLPLTGCYLQIPGQAQIKADCGTLAVPENPADPGGHKIELNIAVVRAVSRAPAADPLFLLAGGPGQSATEAFTMQIFAIDRVRFKRDLVLVDQRGTGKSNPLQCPDPEKEQAVIGVQTPFEEQLAQLDECKSALHVDLALYTTEIAASDLDAVREALGYKQINLLGVSYGTRAALTYLRLYPEHTRSLVLDGVVPPDWALGAQSGLDAQRAIDQIFARCEADAACAAAFPKLEEEFRALLEQVKQSPLEVTVAHPATGAPTRVQMNPDSLAATVRLMSYSDLLAALLPVAIHSASGGDYTLLASQYLGLSESLEQGLNLGMYYSVLCAEDAPYLPAQPPAGEAYFTPRLDEVRAACQRWMPNPPPITGGRLEADTPVLLISGDADPVTPPANGEAVAELLPNSLHIVLPGQGHNNFYQGCVPNLLYNFLDTLAPEELDTTCLEKIQPQPFFLSPVGPEP